ncbi:MAG: hypothetical protein Q8L36_02375 [bacterium]|nr:hypothetical protein [bacterium]
MAIFKKYWKIIIIVFFAIALAVAGYSVKKYFDAKKGDQAVSPEKTANNGSSSTTLDIAGQKTVISLKRVSDQPVFDFFSTNTSTKEIIYITPAGEIYRADEKEDLVLSKQAFKALNRAILSPNHQKIMASFGDPSQPQWLIFDLIDKAWRPLPNTIKQAVWGNDDNELIAIIQENNLKDLVKIKINQNSFVNDVLWRNFSFQDVDLIFVPPQKILITEKSAFFYEGRTWEIDLKNTELNLVFGPAKGLSLRQTADRSLILKFDNNNYLSIVGSNKTTSYETLPEKCENYNRSIYCFLPISWPKENNWPDEYLQKESYTEDHLFLFNDEGYKIIELNNNEKIDGLKPTITGDFLYFLNRRNNNLYQLGPLNQVKTTPFNY